MSAVVRELDEGDNAQLLALSRAVDGTGGAFRVERGPSFFALCRALGDASFYGAFVEGALVACAGLTRQKRYLDGEERVLDYMHDLRVHPDHRGSRIFPQLGQVLRALCDARSGWVFGTIFDGNAAAAGLRVGGGMIGTARPIGHTIHLGIPLLPPRRARGPSIVPLSSEEAWSCYVRLARARNFAPADRAAFDAATGDTIGLRACGRIVGVAKLVDQSRERRIVRADETLPIVYIAYRAAEPGVEDLDAILAHVAANQRHRFSHAFIGLSESEAARRRDRFALRIASTTFAFGTPPEALSLAFHELTLV